MPTILLIDDSASVREVLRMALEAEGYKVLEASDGREGVGLYREHRPALVIADIVMPEKDGIETVKEILAIDPGAVIFTLSGQDADGDYRETSRILGAKWGFQKPVNIAGLISAVREALSQHEGSADHSGSGEVNAEPRCGRLEGIVGGPKTAEGLDGRGESRESPA